MTTVPLQVTTPTPNEIVMTRSFAAPQDLVFDAFTKPELVRRWQLGPDGWSMPVCEIDLRVGGSYRYVWRNDADGAEFGMSGTFRTITPERIVHTERFGDEESLVTITFEAEDAGTLLTMTLRFATPEARDAALATGMADGVEASYARMERTVLLAEPSA